MEEQPGVFASPGVNEAYSSVTTSPAYRNAATGMYIDGRADE